MLAVLTFICLVTAALCQLKLPPEDMGKLIHFSTECQKRSKATQQEIIAMVRGQFSDTPELKNHVFCLGLKLKLITEEGKVKQDMVRKNMGAVLNDEAKLESMMEKCLLQRDDPVDSVYDSIKCVSNSVLKQ